MPSNRLKLYVYTDESGQDVRSRQFVVAVVIVSGSDISLVRRTLQDLEEASGKRKKKWTKSTIAVRRAFWQGLTGIRELQGGVFVKRFTKTPARQNYLALTIQATREALIIAAEKSEAEATVIIDALQTQFYSAVRSGVSTPPAIRVRKVRGLPEESEACLRLADAVAGCARAASEETEYAQVLYADALRTGLVRQLE